MSAQILEHLMSYWRLLLKICDATQETIPKFGKGFSEKWQFEGWKAKIIISSETSREGLK